MFNILFICSGNQCRSPYAQVALSRYSPDWVNVQSAGTLGIEGRPVPPELLSVASEREHDLSSSSSRPLAGAAADKADLVIGMTRDHVAQAVVDGGADAKRSFTLTEFIRLLENEPVQAPNDEDDARKVVQLLHERRAAERSFVPAEDIEDPIGKPRRVYEEMADKLDDLSARFARAWGWM